MNKKTISIICLTALYSILFYQQHVGLNFLLFTLAAIGFFFFQDREAFKTKPVLLISGGAIFSAVFTMIHGSYLSMWTNIIMLFVLPGAVMHRRSSLLIDFFSSLFTTAVSSVFMFIDAINARKNEKGKGFLGLLKYIVPAVFVIAFFFIYRAMNPLFEKFTQDIAEVISLGWVFFTLGGFLLVYSFYKQKRMDDLDNWEKSWIIDINKENTIIPKWNEALSFIILFVILNIMLISVNAMDINYLYMGNGLPEGIDHKQFVHKGVDMLILSIILGISILLFFFRGALNFSKNGTAIKALAFLWVVQNAFMVFSTTIRNTMYVDASLLTYKRIGVYFWLFFALIGLVTLLIKLQRNKSVWFLARHNVTVLFVVLLGSSATDWDNTISTFNLNRAHQMDEISSLDKNYLLSLSEGNINGLFGLKELPGFEVDSIYSYQDRHLSNTNWLDCKVYDFLLDDSEGDWRSYSVRRARVRNEVQQLHASGQITSLELQSHYVRSLEPIYSLNQLEELNLNNSSFNSAQKLEQLNHLPQLKKMFLSGNYIYNLDTLLPNKNLTHLDLQTNNITNLKALSNFPNLDSLSLGSNQLITLSSLPALQHLTILRLDNNPLNEINTLSKLPNLTKLSLNNMIENVGRFPTLVALKELSLSNSPQLIRYGFSNSSFPSLTKLDLSYNELTSIGALINDNRQAKAPKLTTLTLNNNNLRNLYGIEHFEHLSYLDANNNSIYNLAGIEKLTQLKHLHLSSNEITSLVFLENISTLEELTLSYNSRLKDFSRLAALKDLRFLNLAGTPLTNLTVIVDLNGLKNLNLTGCRIVNWSALHQFKELEVLSVSFLKKEDLELFKTMPKLKYLHITNTEENVIALMQKELSNVNVN